MQDHYTTLNIAPGASQAEVKRAFRRRARETHPDLSNDPNAEQRFQRVHEAYEVLSDPKARARYDAQREGVGFGTRVETRSAHAGVNVVWSHSVYTTAPAEGPRRAAPSRRAQPDPLHGYWAQAPVRILTMTLMMTLSLSLMGSLAAIFASAVIVLLMVVGFGLHLHNKEQTMAEARHALMNDYAVTVYGALITVGIFAGLPGLLYILGVIMGQGVLTTALHEWFVLLGIVLRLFFALVSMIIFSSLYAVREEADRLHGQR